MLDSKEAKSRFTYSISTMGCKANLTDSQALESRLQKLGGVAVLEGQEPDLYLLNTCTVTDQADKEAKQLLRKSRAPLTIATGCMAEVSPDELAATKSASSNVKIVRNSAKESVETVVEEWIAGMLDEQRSVLHGDRIGWHQRILPNQGAEKKAENEAAARTRAFYKVQDGCNAFCAYCVIPLARGRSRSLPSDQVVREVQELVDRGVQEVVLTAIHAADYDADGLDFTDLVAKVLRETNVARLRLTSLDPAEIPDKLLDLMESNARLCAHFHISLQSANTRVLRAMKRAYDAEKIEERFLEIAKRLPHAFVGMDLIAGFPGETDEEFEDTYQRLERLPWTKAHVFPFSVRQNTAASRLVDAGLGVPEKIVRERARRLRELSESKMAAALEQKVGAVMDILIEEKRVQLGSRKCSQGHARNYHKVLVPGEHPANTIRRVRIVGVGEKEYLKGEFL